MRSWRASPSPRRSTRSRSSASRIHSGRSRSPTSSASTRVSRSWRYFTRVSATRSTRRARSCAGTSPRAGWDASPAGASTILLMDSRVAAELAAQGGADEELVDTLFRLVLRREPEPEARGRAIAQLADGTLSRATLVHELATSEEFRRVRELDDAVALGLAGRARGERIRWLRAPPGTDERVVEIPVGSRASGWRVGRSRSATPSPSRRTSPRCSARASSSSAPISPSATSTAWTGWRPTCARCPSPIGPFDEILLVSTLEHVGADNTMYGLGAESGDDATRVALRELARVLARDGSLLVTVPLGEPGEHGWFRQDRLSAGGCPCSRAGASSSRSWSSTSSTADGWRAAPSFDPEGVRYGERGPAASAVLCAELSPGRLRRLLTTGGATRRCGVARRAPTGGHGRTT